MVLLNPGTYDIVRSSRRMSARAVIALMRDAGLPVHFVPDRAYDHNGRHAYRVTVRRGKRLLVLMPGVPLKVLRGDIAYAPRLYLEGNSWWWQYAVAILRDEYGGGEA